MRGSAAFLAALPSPCISLRFRHLGVPDLAIPLSSTILKNNEDQKMNMEVKYGVG
jgi:hypothetical protein